MEDRIEKIVLECKSCKENTVHIVTGDIIEKDRYVYRCSGCGDSTIGLNPKTYLEMIKDY